MKENFRRELFWQKRRAKRAMDFFSHGCPHNFMLAVLRIMDEL
jgi:hypothetical protein